MPDAILQRCPQASGVHIMLAGPWRQLAHCRLLRSPLPGAWRNQRPAWPALPGFTLLCAAAADTAEAAPTAPHARATEASGQVMSAQANFVTVLLNAPSQEGEGMQQQPGAPQAAAPTAGSSMQGREELLCNVRGMLKKIKQSVLVGDCVQVTNIDWDDRRGAVAAVLPRSSELADPAIANVDQVLLVFALERPPLDLKGATRFLVSAEAAGLPVAVILNKADLVPARQRAEAVTEVEGWGYHTLALSAADGMGLDGLTAALAGRVSVVAGPSGVGKSSLINALKLRANSSSGSASGSAAAGSSSSSNGAGPAHAAVNASAEGASDVGSSGADQSDVQQGAHDRQGSTAGELLSNGSVSGTGDDAGSSEAGSGSAGAEMGGRAGGAAPSSGADPGGLRPGGSDGGVWGDDGRVWEPVEQWRWMREDAAALGLQPVGDLTAIGRGKHTTRHVSLLEVAGGLLADSPGFNQPSLEGLTVAELPDCFPETRGKAEGCAFRNCQHLAEPGCAVRPGWARHAWYAELHAEVKAAEDLLRHRAGSKKRREGSVRYKSSAGGARTREALLDPKSHRRVNRRQVKQGWQESLKQPDEFDAS